MDIKTQIVSPRNSTICLFVWLSKPGNNVFYLSRLRIERSLEVAWRLNLAERYLQNRPSTLSCCSQQRPFTRLPPEFALSLIPAFGAARGERQVCLKNAKISTKTMRCALLLGQKPQRCRDTTSWRFAPVSPFPLRAVQSAPSYRHEGNSHRIRTVCNASYGL